VELNFDGDGDDVVEKIVVKLELLVEGDELDDVEIEDLEDDECVLLLEVFAVDEELWDTVDVEVTVSRLMQEHF
jgi:hypothetical protein